MMRAMANPQKEDGHVDVANELAEAFARVGLNGTQFRLLWVIVRKTYGWNKKMDTIGLVQFCEATGLPKALVSRELGRLTKRQIILAWGDDHHAKQYGIQKDYCRWLDEDGAQVSTNQSTPGRVSTGRSTPEVSTNRSTPESESVYQSDNKVSTNQSTTKDSKDTSTDSHEPGSLRDRFEIKYRNAPNNKVAVIGELFSMLLGAKPNYERLGTMSKRLNSGGKLMDLIIEASRQRISDDPHDYLNAMVERHRKQGGTTARPTAAEINSARSGKVVL